MSLQEDFARDYVIFLRHIVSYHNVYVPSLRSSHDKTYIIFLYQFLKKITTGRPVASSKMDLVFFLKRTLCYNILVASSRLIQTPKS